MKSDITKYAIVGMGFGFPITVGCMALFGGMHEMLGELLVWMAASALYGILSGIMNSSKVELSLPAALALHCLGCLLITLGAAFLCGYITSAASALPLLIPFAVIYAVVFALCIGMMKCNEKQINQALQKE